MTMTDVTQTKHTFIEPWTPVVGDRVRLRENAECPHRTIKVPVGSHDGKPGTVIAVVSPDDPRLAVPPRHPSHRFVVGYDDGTRVLSSASELDPETLPND